MELMGIVMGNILEITAGKYVLTKIQYNACVRYPDYCPTSKVKSWTIILALAAYLVSFAAGWILSRF